MGEVTGKLWFVAFAVREPARLAVRPWVVSCDLPINGKVLGHREFRRRIDAIAFAARKGIRLVTQ